LGASSKILIQKAIADGTLQSSYTMGLATQDIANGANGKVTWFGKVRGQTNGAQFGESWNDGDIIYISPTTAGYLTKTKPNAPDLVIEVCAVIHSHASNGSLMVRPQWNNRFVDLDDVNGTALTTDGQFAVWDNTNKYFDFTENITDYAKLSGATFTGDIAVDSTTDSTSTTTGSIQTDGGLGVAKSVYIGGGLDIETSTFPGFRAAATTTSTTFAAATVVYERITSGNMVDGFGMNFQFRISDDTSSGNIISKVEAVRDGADNKGTLILKAGSNGNIKFFECRGNDSVNYSNQDMHINGMLVLPKTEGQGIKVDTATPTFGWHDMKGKIETHGVGANEPVFNVYRNGLRSYEFNNVGDESFIEFHMPHDYATGTDMFIHAHWSHHNASTITTGSLTWDFELTYAKGHNQAAFPASVTPTVTHDASVTNVPQYQHMISEVQMSASSPSGTQIDTDDLEIDGLVLCRVALSANTMADNPFLHFVDIHYQSTNIATKNKAPNFYT